MIEMTVEATTEAPQTEAPAEAVAQEQVQQAPPPPTPRAAEALRTLMDREARIREAETSLKQQQQQLEEAQRLQALAKENPLQFLDAVGTSYEDLTARVLKGDRPDPTAGLRREVTELREALNSRQQREETERQHAALVEAQQLVHQYVDSTDQFPLTKASGMHDLVFQRIHDHYNETGQALSEANAAKQVEDYLSGVVDKLAELEAVRNRFAPQEQVTAPSTATSTTTLTNALSSSAPTRVTEKTNITAEESLAKAAAMLKYVNNT